MFSVQDFKSVVDKYKIIFFDAFGVIKSYNGLIPGLDKTFAYLEEQGKEYFIVTNAFTSLILYCVMALTGNVCKPELSI